MLVLITWIDNYYTSRVRKLIREESVVRITMLIDCNVNLSRYNRGYVAYESFDRPCAIYQLSIVVRFIRVWDCGTWLRVWTGSRINWFSLWQSYITDRNNSWRLATSKPIYRHMCLSSASLGYTDIASP